MLRGLNRAFAFALAALIVPSTSTAFYDHHPGTRWRPSSLKLYVMTSNMPDPDGYAAAIEQAIPSWNDVPGASFSIIPEVKTVQAVTGDDTTTVIFAGLVNPNLAETRRTYQISGSDTTWIGADIIFNIVMPWEQYGPFVDATPVGVAPEYSNAGVEEVARHELGHAIGFGHEDRLPRLAVMNSFYSYGAFSAPRLHADDRNGLRSMYSTAAMEMDFAVSGWYLSPFNGPTHGFPNPAPRPATVATGDTLTVDATVENLGTQTVTGLDVGFYLSTSPDRIINGYGLGTLHFTFFPGANGGNNVVPIGSYTLKFMLSCAIVPGQYYVWAFVDNQGSFTEDDETNNAIPLRYPENLFPINIIDGSPAPPSVLGASKNQCDRINLTWRDNSSNETWFKIYRNAAIRDSVPANVTSYTDFPAPGSYSYEVRAKGLRCENANGTMDSGRRIKTPTLSPSGVAASTANCDGIFVEWTWTATGQDQSGFKVFRDGNLSNPVYVGTSPTERTWTDSGVMVGVQHSYKVGAYNACGDGPPSPPSPNGVRVAPAATLAVVTAGSDRCDGIAVSWTWVGSGQSSFEVWRDSPGQLVATPGASPIFDANPGIGPHDYKVRALYPGNCVGGFSVARSGNQLGPPPVAPQNVGASDYTCGVVNVTWTWSGPPPLSGFKIYRNDTLANTLPNPNATSWDDALITPGVPKNYTVRAYNQCGQGPSSTPPEPGSRWASTPTGTPVLTASTGGYCCKKIVLNWTWSGFGAVRFRIYRDGGNVDSVLSTQFSWSDSTIAAGTTHSYQVVARNSCGEGVRSNVSIGTRCPLAATLRVNSNVPGATVVKDGRDTTLIGNTITFSDSVCSTHTLEVSGAQTVSGTRYCFGGWGNGKPRRHSVIVGGDTIIALSLIPTGSGPTTVAADTTLYDDAFDCRSPYKFLGSATLTTSNPADTFRVWGKTSFRAPKAAFPPATLRVTRSFIAKGARFETTDTTSATRTDLWNGLRLSGGGALILDSCEVRNAIRGIADESYSTSIATASVDRSAFLFNRDWDVLLTFDPTRSPSARFVQNAFYNPQGLHIITFGPSLSPVATATITDNGFYSTGLSGSLNIRGGWQGNVDRNTFTINRTGWGVRLEQQSTYASPAVSFSNNFFNTVAGNGRMALLAPPKAGALTQITAQYNNWSYNTRQQIEDLIVHGLDDYYNYLAVVVFEPWTYPPGGGGGRGCPFVLTETPDGLNVENSILGSSAATGTTVSDAYPLSEGLQEIDGKIRLRIAELESEVDEIDEVKLASVNVPDGYQLGSDGAGHPLLYKPTGGSLQELKWTGKGAAFISPVAPGSAYRGEAGDSLEFRVGTDGTVVFPGKRGIGINLIPKPMAAPLPGGPLGITLRVSSEAEGDRWYTLDGVIPRENWSPALVPLNILGEQQVRRIRVVWHSTHTLGWVGVASAEPAEMEMVPCISAQHSSGASVLTELASQDGRKVTLQPGEHVELDFDASRVPEGRRFVLLTHGRYSRPGTTDAPEVPKVYSLAQNRPNPFNPSTEMGFGLPTPSHVNLRIYNIVGQLVRTAVDRNLPAGFHIARWDGRNDQGASVASGVYFYELRSGRFTEHRRMVLLR